ncbi:MAG: hypothetical protein K2P78_14565 [Gemmataceae bacterium]|nr:hypothetical protein [Gemmataceae bacterium]
MVALEWERRETFRYVNTYIRPALLSLGIPFTFVPRKKYSRPGFFWESEEGNTSLLLPAFTNQSGSDSKLPELCSGNWKRDVATRWAAKQPGWKEAGVNCWIGISRDEATRRRGPRTKWFRATYPLLDVLSMHVSGCEMAVERQGWPPAPRSRCQHCPNQSDAEWLELTPEEFGRACDVDEYVRTIDPNAFLHKQMIPLRMVALDPADTGRRGGCTAGMCF